MPVVPNLNLPAGDVRPNLAAVKIGVGDSISLDNNSGSLHPIADGLGYFS